MRLVLPVLMLCVLPLWAEDDAEVYQIYSLLMSPPRTSHVPSKQERYLISDTTAPMHPESPCLGPPPERLADVREVLADFEKRRQAAPRKLTRSLKIDRPYVLASAAEVAAFQKERALPPVDGTAPDQRFLDFADVFTFSEVYFNPRRTLAVVGLMSWCGSLCALYEWRTFEQVSNGKWEERNWTSCSTIAKTAPGYSARSASRGFMRDALRAGR